ncbi:hypothetical protein E4T52_08028 [Aureobasidium sp. EXF-3400]|nr:hypothetical protein E4T51_03669 [Aureobasidium sp. EXF-12344]KAI4777008.1 hypothetical protein E4T52_08028 [Aureobasidium sp. EXF-3400]
MIQHLLTEHSSIINERQLSTYADMCEREIHDTALDACLLCCERMPLLRLHDHLATHMEEIALFVLPLIADDEQDKLKLELQAAMEREREKHDDFLLKQRGKEQAEEQAYLEALRKRKDKEEAKEREYQAFLREQKEKQGAEDKAKEEEEEEARIESALRARLERSRWSQNDIGVTLNPDKSKKKKVTRSPDGEHYLDPTPLISSPPVFPRISRRFLDTETLEHYHVPWEWDRSSGEHIIILRELDKYETDLLFEHTRLNRQGDDSTSEDNHDVYLMNPPRDYGSQSSRIYHDRRLPKMLRQRDEQAHVWTDDARAYDHGLLGHTPVALENQLELVDEHGKLDYAAQGLDQLHQKYQERLDKDFNMMQTSEPTTGSLCMLTYLLETGTKQERFEAEQDFM